MPPVGSRSVPNESDLALALRLADDADRITSARFLADDLVVSSKPDTTPVTDADRAVEAAIRQRLARERPGDAVVGEEFGATGTGPRRWVVDPIDGTKNFVRGVPVWATLIALQVAAGPGGGGRDDGASGPAGGCGDVDGGITVGVVS